MSARAMIGASTGVVAAIGTVVVGLTGTSDKIVEADAVAHSDIVLAPLSAVEAVPTTSHTLCYHVDTGVVVVVEPAGFRWGPGDSSPPLATADVDLPADYDPVDLSLQRWVYRDGEMMRVPGREPPAIVDPEPDPVEDGGRP